MESRKLFGDSISGTALVNHGVHSKLRRNEDSKSTQCDFPRIFARYALERDFAIKVEHIRDCAAQAVYELSSFSLI